MTERRLVEHRTWLEVTVLGLTGSLLLIAAAGVMFSVFMFYDDEGYVLNSYRAFIERGALYREVYTQYGPFPFLFYQLLDILGIPITHTSGRVVTLSIWTGCSLGCAALVRQSTRSLPLQLAVVAGTFVYLWVLASEPSHPGGLIVALTVALAVFGSQAITSNRTRAWSIAGGVVTAMSILTKINVGGFLGCAIVAWWALHHTDNRVRRVALWILPVGATLLPLALMRPLLGTPWVQNFAAVFAVSAIAVVVTIARTAAPRARWSHAGWAALAGTVTAAIVLSIVLAQGTGTKDLLDGILFGPLRHPVVFSLRYLWPPGIVVVAGLSLLLALSARIWHSSYSQVVDSVVASLRLVATLALAWNITRYPTVSPDYAAFGWAMPCLWLFLWPLSEKNLVQAPARAWVALLLLGQCLHVFPVPGSQIAWGTVLVIPLAALGGWEAVVWLASRVRSLNPIQGTLAGRVALLFFFGLVSWKFMRVAARYNADDDLRLPGAESLRLPASFSAALRVLVVNASAHADVLFSFPGMFSFNLWSGVPTPTHANVTHWFSLLNANQQNEIIKSLAARPKAVVIVHREHLRFLTGRGLTPRGPLREYIDENFVAAFTVDDYEFRVHRGRSITPFFVADILTRSPGVDAKEPDTLMQLTVLLPAGTKIDHVDVVSGEGADARVLRLDAGTARVETTPLTIRGAAAGASIKQTWPIVIEQPTLLSLYYDQGNQIPPVKDAVIILRSAEGATLTTARLRQ